VTGRAPDDPAQAFAAVVGGLAADPSLAPVGLLHFRLGRRALDSTGPLLDDLAVPVGVPVVVLVDGTPMRVREEDLSDAVRERVAATGREARLAIVPTSGGLVHADQGTLDAVVGAVADARAIVTAGSGTLTDVGKAVAHRLDLPHLVVQSALSVNGYADDRSVLLVNGAKRTVGSRWPDALVIDTDVLAAAPIELNRSGVGDLISMFTAPADWLAANRLGMGSGYSARCVGLVRGDGDEVLRAARGLAERDPQALEYLAWVLTLSGLSMGAAGMTAPSSGAEHLVSHMLDMAHLARGQEVALHGAQVGISTVLVCLVWDSVRAALRDGPRPRSVEPAVAEASVRAAFASLDPTGALGEECWSAYRVKLERWDAVAGPDWAALEAAVAPLLIEAERLADAMRAAGLPLRYAALDPAADRATLRWALANGPLMRDRFAVTDLAYFLGVWDDDRVDEVLRRGEALGVGA
jgi:glycerol-1-phosphate dehydrogenase [NAD(P)+]